MQVPFTTYYLENAWALLLLLLLPIIIWYRKRAKGNQEVSFRLSTILSVAYWKGNNKVIWFKRLPLLLYAALVLLIIGLSRPQDRSQARTVSTEGIDIMLSIDVSPSMDAEDLQPTRLEAAKAVAIDFVKGRPNDRIGLVIFAAESFTQCPATTDHQVLIEQIRHLNSNLLLKSTAIGMGLASAVNSLRLLPGKSKVVILMTDGVNETGSISPETALEIAQMYGVRVYTIGVGSAGEAYMPMVDEWGNVISKQKVPVLIDEELLSKIAEGTGGKYYRAVDNKSLSNIYAAIDQLEKQKIQAKSFTSYEECYRPVVLWAMVCMALFLVLKFTYFRTVSD